MNHYGIIQIGKFVKCAGEIDEIKIYIRHQNCAGEK